MAQGSISIRRILVATDFSEHAAAALGRAVWLAERTGATITLAHVITGAAWTAPATEFTPHLGVQPGALRKAERKLRVEAEERLAQCLAPCKPLGLKTATATPAGVPFVELIRLVQKSRYDLVLAGTRGLAALKRFLLGSTAERLARKCPCPVWVVRPGHEWPLRSILAPVDFSEVSAKSTHVAAFFAGLTGSPLTVLHVIEQGSFAVPLAELGVDPGLAMQRREVRRAASKQLNDFVAKHIPSGIDVRQQLGVGAPWQVIDRVAGRIDAGLIVMGSVGRAGVPGFFIGNTAEKVLRSCDRSILTVKPDGFVSPVEA